MDDKFDEINKITAKIADESLVNLYYQMVYEHKVLTGKLPWPKPMPLKVPFTYEVK